MNLKPFLKWWQGRRWIYIGYTTLEVEFKNRKKPTEDAGTVHFFIWGNNQKRRKVLIMGANGHKLREDAPFYQQNIVPWLHGADVWAPVQHKIATQGTLINYVGNQPTP